MPSTPNFKPGVGKLATDRYDFNDHTDGSGFRHHADQIDLVPTVVIGSTEYTEVQSAIVSLRDHLTVPIFPNATTLTTGAVQLAGDLNGTSTTATAPKVGGLQGFPVSPTSPATVGTGSVLTWDGSVWVPQLISAAFTFAGDVTGTAAATTVVKINGKPVSAAAPNTNDVLTWNGSTYTPLSFSGTSLSYAGTGTWADGTTNPATTVSGQLDKIVSDLSPSTGDVKIGSPLRSGTPTTLSAGTLGSQISGLLNALNAFQIQKGAVNGLAPLDGSSKVINTYLNTGVANGLATLDATSHVTPAQLNTGVANGLATLDATAHVTPAQLNTGVANGLATLDATAHVTPSQLNTAVGLGLATLDGSVKLVSAQRAGWFVTDSMYTNDSYGTILTTYSTNSFTDDGYLSVTLGSLLVSDVIIISISAGVSSTAAGGGEFQVVANSNAGPFTTVPGTIMRSFNTGSNQPSNPVDRWASVSKYTVTDNGSSVIKVQGRTITGAGNSFTNGSCSLHCAVYRP